MHIFRRIALLILIALTAGCASTPEPIPPPSPTAEPVKVKNTRQAATPIMTALAKTSPAAAALTDTQAHELVLKLLPLTLKDREGWAGELQSAFRALQIQPNPAHFCAVISVIEQESSFQADPVVPGLPAIVRHELKQRSEKYGIPQSVIDWMLTTSSRDGRSYGQRIDTLKTEKELSDLIEEIVARVPAGAKLYPNYNPIRTGGPMQVSVEFAEAHARARPYPYPIHGSLRNEVFSRRGGLYFGSAILLDYPAPYDDILYRFADFNAGRYSSRNAAFQRALSGLTGKPLATDGDLLRYKNGAISPDPSSTFNALLTLERQLQMDETAISRDLTQEKLSGFSKTQLYNRLFALADRTGAKPRVAMPQIDLASPKFSRKLTTQWFAKRVYGRYLRCLQQGGATADKPSARTIPGR